MGEFPIWTPGPQDIIRFKGAYDCFSNFSPSRITFYDSLDGTNQSVATVEHAYQSEKSLDPEIRRVIRNSSTPGKAKQIGGRIPLRHDWSSIRIDVMKLYLVKKFRPGTLLRRNLLDTKDRLLMEGNTWGDRFWGCIQDSSGVWRGHNYLGCLLMSLREKLQLGELWLNDPSIELSFTMITNLWQNTFPVHLTLYQRSFSKSSIPSYG